MTSRNLIKIHISHLLYYFNPFGWKLMPSAVTIELTNRCNLRCEMCWWNFSESRNSSDQDTELTIDEIDNFLLQIAGYKPTITVTGSEPFMRKDAMDIISLIKQRGIPIHSILTNGTLLDEKIAKTLIEAKPYLIQISIDGDQETHDNIRGVPGSYLRALRGIDLVSKAKKESGEKLPYIRINCVISNRNINTLRSLVDLAESLGVELQFQHLMWLDKSTINLHKAFMLKNLDFQDKEGENLENDLREMDIKFLLQEINYINNECSRRNIPLYFLQFSNPKTIVDWYSNSTTAVSNKCLEPFLTARVSATGDVKFCPLIDYSYGNIKTDRFSTIWKNSRSNKIKKELKRHKLFPGCSRCCKLIINQP